MPVLQVRILHLAIALRGEAKALAIPRVEERAQVEVEDPALCKEHQALQKEARRLEDRHQFQLWVLKGAHVVTLAHRISLQFGLTTPHLILLLGGKLSLQDHTCHLSRSQLLAQSGGDGMMRQPRSLAEHCAKQQKKKRQ